LLRWKSHKSLLIYARRNPAEVAEWLDRTLSHEVSSVRGANIPSPLATVPNSLADEAYAPLFQAQSPNSPITDANIHEAFTTINQLQLDGSEFVHQFQSYTVLQDLDTPVVAADDTGDDYDSADDFE
jgi:hypothetical protein